MFFLSVAYGIMLLAAQAEGRPTSAALAELPHGISADEDGTVYGMVPNDDGVLEREDYGATRLNWDGTTLHMRGVLTDLDWMRALGQSATATYNEEIKELAKLADTRADEVREAKRTGKMERDATWSVEMTIPVEAGELVALAGLPTHEVNREDVPIVKWNPETRTLTATDTLSERDKAQLLAAGAEPRFRRAITSIYESSSVLRISILWLFAFYMVLTIGELCLSPVGLSLVTKAAPPKYVGLFMGLWLLYHRFRGELPRPYRGGVLGDDNACGLLHDLRRAGCRRNRVDGC